MDGLRIVLFEKDNSYRWKLSSFLRSHGCNVIAAETVSDIYDQTHNPEWAIYLVNFSTDTSWGIEFLTARDRRHHCPVLVLSDNDDHVDRIVCLELGADDYIVKTAHHREILARIRVARRRGPLGMLPSLPAKPIVAEPAPSAWTFAPETRELTTPNGNRIDLTADQFGLLDILMQHAGKPLSRDYLSRTLFDRPLKDGDRSIDNLVVRLRRRLGEAARAPQIIRTARSGGYFFGGFPITAPAQHQEPVAYPEKRAA
jgi:DNA-binding response OmpR family regulator